MGISSPREGRKSSKMPAPISFLESMGIVSGVGLAVIFNLQQRKPMHTGIYKHIILGGLGYFCGKSGDVFYKRQERQTLLVLEDYVRLHPEDFPEEAPKTYGEILMKWYPNR